MPFGLHEWLKSLRRSRVLLPPATSRFRPRGKSRRYVPKFGRFSRRRRPGYLPIIQFAGPSSLRMTQNHNHSTTPAQPHQRQGGEFARSPQRQGTTAAPSALSENASPQIVHLSIIDHLGQGKGKIAATA